MDNLFSGGTCELLNDTVVNAIDDARKVGMPDWEAREEFLKVAGAAFDMIAEDRDDAARPEFLG